MNFEWRCPFCDRHQIVIDNNYQSSFQKLYIGETVHGDVGVSVTGIRCANVECNEVTLIAELTGAQLKGQKQVSVRPEIGSWNLRPESESKPQPSYIPAPLREDYLEACLIRDKSPKAAATLARRCLQGMIRDFCQISKNRLIDEITELRKLVDAGSAPKGVDTESIDAIDAVRSVGNIGAHMERDINLIVDVEPGEAQALIELIEMLFDDWYVARHQRQQRLANVQAIAAEKAANIAEQKKEAAQLKVTEEAPFETPTE